MTNNMPQGRDDDASDDGGEQDRRQEAEQLAAGLQELLDDGDLDYDESSLLTDTIAFLRKVTGSDTMTSESLRTKNWANSLKNGRSVMEERSRQEQTKKVTVQSFESSEGAGMGWPPPLLDGDPRRKEPQAVIASTAFPPRSPHSTPGPPDR
jgi:hypothetical protein